MALGTGEDPSRSVSPHLQSVDYPARPEQLARAAMQANAPADVINLLNALPQGSYESPTEVMRDLAEAARRFAMGNVPVDEGDGALRDRRNIGRDLVENAPEGKTRHP
jgi:hypothetical protein